MNAVQNSASFKIKTGFVVRCKLRRFGRTDRYYLCDPAFTGKKPDYWLTKNLADAMLFKSERRARYYLGIAAKNKQSPDLLMLTSVYFMELIPAPCRPQENGSKHMLAGVFDEALNAC